MKDSILASIREKKVTMRSTTFFKAELAFFIFSVVVALIVSTALVSYILFALRINGHDALLGFGAQGIAPFLSVFPWTLLIVDIVLLVVIQRSLQRFSFGYKSPALFALFALIVIIGAVAFALDRGTHVNDDLMREGKRGTLPTPLNEVYGRVRVPAPHDQGIYRGVITEIATSTVVIRHDDLDTDADDKQTRIMLPPRFNASLLVVGMNIYVAGREEHGVVKAYGIRVLKPER